MDDTNKLDRKHGYQATSNFWSDLEASRSESDLSFFSYGSSATSEKNDVSNNASFTPYNQWSGQYFPQYSLFGSSPLTRGLEPIGTTASTHSPIPTSSSPCGSPPSTLGREGYGVRPETQMLMLGCSSPWYTPPHTPGPDPIGTRPQSTLTCGTGGAVSMDWMSLEGSSDRNCEWRGVRRDSGSVMCTYDSSRSACSQPFIGSAANSTTALYQPNWSGASIGTINNPQMNTYPTNWSAPVQRAPPSSYDARLYLPLVNYDQESEVAMDSVALDNLAEKFKEFKLKPQILTNPHRISERKLKANKLKQACVECVFCKNNEEKEEIYKSHVLKDAMGNVRCPVLRLYRCPICGNPGGDQAHTIRYCPFKNKKLDTLTKANARNRK